MYRDSEQSLRARILALEQENIKLKHKLERKSIIKKIYHNIKKIHLPQLKHIFITICVLICIGGIVYKIKSCDLKDNIALQICKERFPGYKGYQIESLPPFKKYTCAFLYWNADNKQYQWAQASIMDFEVEKRIK